MQLKISICDDEKIICDELERKLLELNPDYSVGCFGSGTALLASGRSSDLIFLDIEMPELDGMETARQLRLKNGNEYIIFLTSHTEFMPEAFKVRAFRFLRKPIEDGELKEAVCEAEKEIMNNVKLAVTVRGVTELVNLSDIICFEAFGDGTYIYTKSKVFESGKPMKYWMEKAGSEHFFQIHRAYYAAFRYVRNIEGSTVSMHYMKHPIDISRRKLSLFKKALADYIRKDAKYI